MAPPVPSRQVLQPEGGVVVAGKYQLTRLLRQGGMGSVWVATHLGLEVPVAIKFMTANLGTDARARFAREAKSAAQIRGANVVQILDHGIDRGLPYIVMELLDGEDLGARLRRIGRMALGDVARFLGPVSRALDRAHENGLVHRDLKPENIFLAREGDVEVPKVLDFGIAKALSEIEPQAADGTTREGALIGTPFFMSPEQARGRLDVDHRSDLWSLGVIVFRAITGVKPFDGRTMPDVIVQICADPIPRPSVLCPDLGPEVDAFFVRALARDPNLRFQSARELATAFTDLLPSSIRTAQQHADAALRHAAPPAPMPPRSHPEGAMPTPSWPSVPQMGSGNLPPHPLSSSGVGTPPPGYGSWPGTGSGSGPGLYGTGDRTGGTIGRGVQLGSIPAEAPAKTPWVLLGTLATIATVTITAAVVAFFQSRHPAPAATVEPAAPVHSAAQAPSADPEPAAAESSVPPEASGSASAAASVSKKPAVRAGPAPAATSSASKRDLGY